MTSPSPGEPQKSMAWKVVDRLFLVAYGKAPPTNEEWDAYLHDIERHGIERTMQIIVTEGGAPTTTQRRYLVELLAGRSVPIVVLCEERAVRLVVKVMTWFNGNLRVFPPTGIIEALAHLSVPRSRADLIERELARLRLSLTRAGGTSSDGDRS